jgi:UDP-N-acetylglucosamine--N-acetylmuramyl-(pentapeptide) pyrophosphoryl-undecaprenol N-acetylglucosamine transferase
MVIADDRGARMRVVLAGGGSAGHIEPALALADALREADGAISVTCLGTQRGLETRLVPLRGYELQLIPAVPLPRSVSADVLAMPGRLAGAVHAAGQILERAGADVVVGFGGYVSAPAYLAAKRHHVPIVVHEANPSPGFANRLGAMLSPHVYTGHPDTKLRNAQFIGLPIRRTIAGLDRFKLGDQARAHFGLRPDLPVLLVFGGSQGAVALNRALSGAVGPILNAGVQVLHVTGPKNVTDVQVPRGQVPYVAVPYVDQMDLAYAAADFALCRAGAMTCAELTAVGLPAAYVPLPHGNGEQRLNAQPIVAKGGGMMVDDAELTAQWIVSSMLPVLTNIDHVAAMSEAAASLGHGDADRALAKAVIDIVSREQAANAAAQAARNAPPEGPDPLDEPVTRRQSFDAFVRPAPGGHPTQQYPQGQYPPQSEYPPQNQYPPQQQYPQGAGQYYPGGGQPQPSQYPPAGQYPQGGQPQGGGRHRR